MHLQDKELFSFGDSIYRAIESSDGFAIELNPADMMDTLFKIFAKPDNSPLIKNILSKKQYDKVAEKLSKKLKIPADKITTKRISDERHNWLSKQRKKGDMETFMDMYFYTIAQNQGKYVSGIEDLGDQIGLLDDLDGMNIEDYVQENDNTRLKSLNEMKATYIDRDLNKIEEQTYGNNGSPFHDEVLVKRNIKMARRMDSLAQIRNSFFAVGAAHLVGDSGLITLLRKRGFVVEPVSSSKYIRPEDYHYTKKEIKWIDVEDDRKISSVQMPGQPTLINLSDVIPMHMYMDLSNNFCYGISVIPMADKENDDSIFSKLITSYKSEGYEIISTKKIEELDAKGIMLTFKYEGYFRFKVLIKGNKLFLLIFGVQDEEKLNAPDGDKFFNSLKINNTNLNQQTNWQVFSDKQNAFSISLPANPISKFEKGTTKTYYDVYTYTTSDYSDGSYYMMIVKNSLPGFFLNSDSLLFEFQKQRFTENTGISAIQTSELFVNGCHGYEISAEKKFEGKDYVYKLYMIFRGNRIYIPMTVSEKGRENSEEIKNFFKSFTFLSFDDSKWKQHVSPSNDFIAWSPSDFELKKIDSSTNEISGKRTLFSSDKKSIVDYSVESEPYSKYYWSNSDSAFFKKLTDTFKAAEDSLIYYHKFEGDSSGAEVLIKIHNSGLYKRLRTLFNGDTLYTLFSYFPEELKNDKNTNLFFDKFKFVNPRASSIFKNKQDQLMAALLSDDSATRSVAAEAFNKIDFAKNDLNFLHSGWLKLYPADSSQYQSINYYFSKKIESINDPLTIDFIENNYNNFNSVQPELQINMLEVLKNFKTEKSYALLKKLLLRHPPATGPVYSLSGGLADSLSLTKDLFPEVERLYADSIIGSALIKLTVDLIDSNKMSLEDVRDNVELIYSLAKKQLKQIKSNTDEYPVYNDYVIKILQKLNSKQSIELLRSFMQASNIEIKYNSVLALLKLNQAVLPSLIHSIAANNGYRTQLYSSLKEINKASLFPRDFLSQQKFAESYVYNYASEDEDSVTIQAEGERMTKVNGQPKRYYLFKLNSVYDTETSSHLAICGPFDMDKKKFEINDDNLQVNVFYDEEYNPESTERLFQQFLNPPSENITK